MRRFSSQITGLKESEDLAGREPLEIRDGDLDDEAAARLEVRNRIPETGDLHRLWRQASIVFWTGYTREKGRSAAVTAKPPIVTPMPSPPAFTRSLATTALDSSIP